MHEDNVVISLSLSLSLSLNVHQWPHVVKCQVQKLKHPTNIAGGFAFKKSVRITAKSNSPFPN